MVEIAVSVFYYEKLWGRYQKRQSLCVSCLFSEDFVLTDQIGPIFTIGINRPTKRNCVNHETALQLISAFKKFDENEDLNVAILYGAGGNFCSGYDLQSLSMQDDAALEKIPPIPDGLIDKELFRYMVCLGPAQSDSCRFTKLLIAFQSKVYI